MSVTFNPTGGTREAFNALFQLPAQLAAETENRQSADNSLALQMAQTNANLLANYVTAEDFIALQKRVEALEQAAKGGDGNA